MGERVRRLARALCDAVIVAIIGYQLVRVWWDRNIGELDTYG